MNWLKNIFNPHLEPAPNEFDNSWPKWDNTDSFRTKNFRFSCSVVDYTGKTDSATISLLKDRRFLEQYIDLFRNNKFQNILEIGFFQGGMPLFIVDMFAPRKILAVDWNPPSEALQEILNANNISSVKLIGNVDQSDTTKIRSLIDEEFGAAQLDLIIDDCSHYYEQTKACFEALFGYLRPGGKYIIEDWGWTHWPGSPWQTPESHFNGMHSMTNLIFELTMALASDQNLIASIEIISHSCVIVTRGENLAHKKAINLKALTNIAGDREAKLIAELGHPKNA